VRWGDVIRGVFEGLGLVRELVQAGRDPGREIRRIRIEERLRTAEAKWRRDIADRFDKGPTTERSARVEDIYGGLDP